MSKYDKTVMGGSNEVFTTTVWSDLEAIRENDAEQKRLVMENLLAKYWKPVYCYLRAKGQDNESAKDLTQGFFQEIVLDRNLLEKVNPARGRFRTFLLTSLDHYVTNVFHRENAKKRNPSGRIDRLDIFEEVNVPDTHLGTSAERIYIYAWASDLLKRVLADVEQECRSGGQEIHWKVFSARVLDPLFHGITPVGLSTLCDRYHISNESRASNMIITVKRRFKNVLFRHIRKCVNSEEEVQPELDEIIQILSQKGAR